MQQKLILGGHTFISQLGSDLGLTLEQQTAIVAECLVQGIG